MTQENTDESPSVPEGFGGIMDPDYAKVHKDIYGDGDVDIPMPGDDITTQAAPTEAQSTGDFSGGWQGYNAYMRALELAAGLEQGRSADQVLEDAKKFADFLTTPLR